MKACSQATQIGKASMQRQAECMHSENICALFAVKQAGKKLIFRPACLLLALTGERYLRQTGLPVMTVKPLGFKSPVTVV